MHWKFVLYCIIVLIISLSGCSVLEKDSAGSWVLYPVERYLWSADSKTASTQLDTRCLSANRLKLNRDHQFLLAEKIRLNSFGSDPGKIRLLFSSTPARCRCETAAIAAVVVIVVAVERVVAQQYSGSGSDISKG